MIPSVRCSGSRKLKSGSSVLLTKLHSTSGNAISRLGSLHESALKREYPRELSSPLSSHVPHRLRAGTCVNACFYCRASRPSKLRNRSRCRHSAKATPVHNEHRIDPKAPNVVRSCILLPLCLPERLPDLPAVLHLLRLQTAMQDDHDLLEQNDCSPPQVSGRQNSSIADALPLPFADLASPGEKRVRNHAKTRRGRPIDRMPQATDPAFCALRTACSSAATRPSSRLART